MKTRIYLAFFLITISFSFACYYFNTNQNYLDENCIEINTLLSELEEDFITKMEFTSNDEKINFITCTLNEFETINIANNYFINKLIIKIPLNACSCYSEQLLNLFSEIPSDLLVSGGVIMIIPMNQLKEYDQFLAENGINVTKVGCYKPINNVLDAGLYFYCFTINEDYLIKDLMIVRHNKRLLSKYISSILSRFY